MKKRLLEMEQESFPVTTENNADSNDGSRPTSHTTTKNAPAARVPDANQPQHPMGTDDAVADADARSIYVGNVSSIPLYRPCLVRKDTN